MIMFDRFNEKLRQVYQFKKKYAENKKAKPPFPFNCNQSCPDETQTLTEEEYKVFMLLREGFTVKECSERLNMKRRVVRNNTKKIYRKLNIGTITELIVKYRRTNQDITSK